MINRLTSQPDRVYLAFGHAIAVFFIILSVAFYQERLFAFDSAYYFFKMLLNEGFNIEHNRVISYSSQWLPLIIMKLGGSLKTISISYSLSFMVFYYALFLVHAYLFKSPKTGILLFLILVLSTRFKHYNAVSEVTATMALSSLFIGWVWIKEKYIQFRDWQSTLIAILLLALNWTGHPIIYLPILGFLGVYLTYKSKWKDPQFWIILGVTLVMFYLRFATIPSSGYEANKLEALQKAPEVLPSITKAWTYQNLKDYILDNYPIAWWAYLAALAFLLVRKKILTAIVSFVSFAVFVCVVVLIYYNGESIMMLESYYALFGYFWAIPLFIVLLESDLKPLISHSILAGLLIYSSIGIYNQHRFFTQRLEYIDELVDKGQSLGTSKVLLSEEQVDWNRLMVPWALPFGSTLHTAINSPNEAATIYVYRKKDREKYGQRLKEADLFLGAHFNIEQFRLSELPEKYFVLSDGYYQEIQ